MGQRFIYTELCRSTEPFDIVWLGKFQMDSLGVEEEKVDPNPNPKRNKKTGCPISILPYTPDFAGSFGCYF